MLIGSARTSVADARLCYFGPCPLIEDNRVLQVTARFSCPNLAITPPTAAERHWTKVQYTAVGKFFHCAPVPKFSGAFF